MRRRLFVWTVSLALIEAARAVALAQDAAPRVVLVDPGASLESATRASLEPWNVDVLVVQSPSPGATMPGTSEAARAVALAHAALAVVWVSEDAAGFALWIYDADTDQVSARALTTPPPFDALAAAGVALAIKTLLRHSAVAPESERFGAEVAPSTAPAREPEPEPTAPEAAPEPVVARELEVEPAPAPEPAAEPAPSSPARFELEGRGGARFGSTDPDAAELRLGLGFAYFPSAGPLGAFIRVASGPGVATRDDFFEGRLTDTEVMIGGAVRWAFGRVRIGAGLGATMHVTLLDGTALTTGASVEVVRVNPSLDVTLAFDVLVSRSFRIGLHAGGAWRIRTQRYLVEENVVLSVSPMAFETALVVGAMLPE
jgi:hypothetical protein